MLLPRSMIATLPHNNNNDHQVKAPLRVSASTPRLAEGAASLPRPHSSSSIQSAMLFCDALSPSSCPSQADHIPSDLPVRLSDEESPDASPPTTPPPVVGTDPGTAPPGPTFSRSLGICIPSSAASAPPAPVFSRSLGRSLGSSYDDDQPLPIATVAKREELRVYRITSTGLVSTMGAFLDKPKTNKDNDSGVGQGLKYAMATMQGWRVDMEDAHVAKLWMGDVAPFSSWSFFAVFDGHAGSVAAEFAASNVLQTLLEGEHMQQVAKMVGEKEGRLCAESCALLEKALKQGFLALDDKIRDKLDSIMGKDRSGTTAVCAIVTPSHIVLANLGDSRAVLSRRDEDTFGTEDHKPCNEKERQRIISAGGSVMIQRINGSLAVSRALGDFEYKCNTNISPSRQQVSPEPDVYTFERQSSSDEYLILACDGIYDVMSNDELCSFVHSRLEVAREGEMSRVCNEVLDACLQKGSRDNMTLLLVAFDAAPVLKEDKAKEEEKHMVAIRSALTEIIEESLNNGDSKEELCVEYVLRTLNNTRPEAVPSDGHIRLLVRSIAERVIAELTASTSNSTTLMTSSGSSPSSTNSGENGGEKAAVVTSSPPEAAPPSPVIPAQ